MKKLLLSLSLLVACITVEAQGLTEKVNIPDANFLQVLIDKGVDINKDGDIQYFEASFFKDNYLVLTNLGISDLTGIEAFSDLEHLFCDSNNLITLDVTNLSKLKRLYCSYNDLTTLNASNLADLEQVFCDFNALTTLKVSGTTSLTQLSCVLNELTTLDVSTSKNLGIFHYYCN